jgi:hypothetical protein
MGFCVKENMMLPLKIFEKAPTSPRFIASSMLPPDPRTERVGRRYNFQPLMGHVITIFGNSGGDILHI